MTEAASPSKSALRTELSRRIREALELRDWQQMDHWAQQWIQLDPRHPSGFKWLARAALALNQIKRAAYAYGRLLDFEPGNEEATRFFAQFPSSLDEQPPTVEAKLSKAPLQQKAPEIADERLGPEARRVLAQAELELAETYARYQLFAESAARYRKSYDWHPSQASALGAAVALNRQGQGWEAVKFLRQQLFSFPDWSDGRILLGRILRDLGQKLEAQREWQLVLENDPRNTEALDLMRNMLTSGI